MFHGVSGYQVEVFRYKGIGGGQGQLCSQLVIGVCGYGERLTLPRGFIPVGEQERAFRLGRGRYPDHQVVRRQAIQNGLVLFRGVALHQPGRAQNIPGRVIPQQAGQAHGFPHGFTAFPETEVDHCQLFHFIKAVFTDTLVANLVDIAKAQGQDVILPGQAFAGQRHAEVQGGVFAGVHA